MKVFILLVAVIDLYEFQFSTRVLRQNERWGKNTVAYTYVKEWDKERGLASTWVEEWKRAA